MMLIQLANENHPCAREANVIDCVVASEQYQLLDDNMIKIRDINVLPSTGN